MRVIDVIRNVDGIVNQLFWDVALVNGHTQIGVECKCTLTNSHAYTQESKTTQNNHTSKIFQAIDVALNFTQQNCIKGLEYFATQTTFHQTSNSHKQTNR